MIYDTFYQPLEVRRNASCSLVEFTNKTNKVSSFTGVSTIL